LRLTNFLAASKLFRRPGGNLIHVRDQEEIAGLTLLKLTLAWESFLEDTFLRYLCGAKSAAGVSPTLLLGKQPKLNAAFRALSGSNKFLGWQPDTTLKRANKFFDAGEPYETAVKGAKSVLEDMGSIRNRIAHRSDHSVIEFQAVVQVHFGFVPRGMTPGRFLLSTLPILGIPAIDHYTGIVKATAHLIANHT
jgi:hypothetical protein